MEIENSGNWNTFSFILFLFGAILILVEEYGKVERSFFLMK